MVPLKEIREAFNHILELPQDGREAGLAELPPSMRAEVAALLAAHQATGHFLDTAEDSDSHVGERLGPYLLTARIGQGGMGIVYRARRDDGEFQREVAIKLVGGRLFAPEAERRFIAERRILAMLDHPNIVRMIDGGVWNGQRYLVMELISGRPITEHCAGLPIAARLRVFQAVCAAIQYAHQHLVIHRDLKASNILVTPEGEVKVLDFGIATLLDERATDAGVTALHPVTLVCASPEQVLEERLTSAADIYALGLLLYDLLSGVNPQAAGTRAEIVQRILSEDPPPPSKWAHSVSRDLDAIALKALAKEPARRYASAQEMSADIDRFLHNRPVLARAPSRRYIAARFCARNKAATVIAAALLLAVLTGLAAFSWQARRAEQQRAIAQRRFDEARRLIHTVIHDIQPKLAALNGSVALRQSLIEETLVYLEALGKDAADNPALTRELIDSYVELASVAGDPGVSSTGNEKRAAEILAKAKKLADTLYANARHDDESTLSLLRYYRAQARHVMFFGSAKEALAYAERALALAERRVASMPHDSQSQQWLASALMTAADAGSYVKDQPDQRIALLERSLAIWLRLLREDPSDRLRTNAALAYKSLSSDWLSKGDYQRAAEMASKALDLDQMVLDGHPSSPAAQIAVSFDLSTLGSAWYKSERYPEALRTFRENVAIRDKLVAANPDDRRAKDRLAYALGDLGDAEADAGKPGEAKSDYLRALHIYTQMAAAGPLVQQSARRFVLVKHSMGELEARSGNPAEACPWFVSAEELLRKMERETPASLGDFNQAAAVRADAAACTGGGN